MTRDELIEKVARSILYERYFVPDYDSYKDEKEFWENLDEDHLYDAKSEAVSAIDTIFAALKEPTASMSVAGCEADDPLVGLIDWNGDNCTTREAVNAVWQAMLSASPLAPNNKENK